MAKSILGFDVGTYTLVCSNKKDKSEFSYKKEINAFLELPLDNRFVFNMMKNAGVPLIEKGNVAYALGESAVNMAYTLPSLELKRPMCDGCVNPKEKDAFQILSIMIHSLIGDIQENSLLYYCVPANAINLETDADYHGKVLQAIFNAYESSNGSKLEPRPINEALALVYAELGNKNFTGIACSCLCPDTKIYTNQGILNIQDVKENYKVITHKGRYRNINKVITKNFKGTMTKIQITGYSNDTNDYKFVDNHELYVKRNGNWQWIGCESLEVGDIVGEPILNGDSTESDITLTICEKTTNSLEYNKKQIKSSCELQRLIGYFLGDGSINTSEGCIQFDFRNDEKENIYDVQKLLKDIFEKNSSLTCHGENCTRIKCYSKGLTNYFSNHFYDENKVKFYPWSLSKLSENECLNLLIGLIRSDGSIFEDQLTFGNTNTNLIILAKQCFSRINIPASINWREPRKGGIGKDGKEIVGKKNEWIVSSAGKKVSMSLVEKFENVNSNKVLNRMFIEDGFCCGRIQKIEKEEYDGIVYDLQVEEDHSFSGPFLTIHNCGGGMVNVCFAMYGNPIFQFAIVNSGDWIDKQAAKATGESPTFINKEKMKVSLIKEPTNLIERAIQTQYKLMIEKTIVGIKNGLANAGKSVRIAEPIDFVVAGGTSSIEGFKEIFEQTIKSADLSIPIGNVIRPSDPLFSVARGCYIAAEASLS